MLYYILYNYYLTLSSNEVSQITVSEIEILHMIFHETNIHTILHLHYYSYRYMSIIEYLIEYLIDYIL